MHESGRRAGLGSHHATVGITDEWFTPPWVFDALGVTFGLDPCAPPVPHALWLPVQARYTKADDGLVLPWAGRVWLNPPYGREIERWMRKLAAHGNGIALVPGRTDTGWYHAVMPAAAAKVELKSRITFIPGPGNPGADPERTNGNSGAPSILIAFGQWAADVILGADLVGICYRNRTPRPVGYQPTLWETAHA